jgi:hypothetical protein
MKTGLVGVARTNGLGSGPVPDGCSAPLMTGGVPAWQGKRAPALIGRPLRRIA